MSSSVDEIFQISSDDETTEMEGSTRQRNKSEEVPAPEKRSRKPDYTEAIDDIREQIDTKAVKFEREFEELKRRHAEQLSLLKHNNVTKEQAAANSYNIEYRNVVWSVTLRHLGKGVFTEDIGPLLEHSLSEQQFRLEKELVELQQTYDDEIAQMRAQLTGKSRKRRRVRRTGQAMQPEQMARMICDRLDELEPQEVEDDGNDVILNQLITMIKKETEELIDCRDAFVKLRKPRVIVHRVQEAEEEELPRRKPRQAEPSFLARHKEASNKLVKSMAKADRFLRNLQKQEWFDDLFPHVE